MLKDHHTVRFPCPPAGKDASNISQSEYDSDAKMVVSNVIPFKPRLRVGSRPQHDAFNSTTDSFFSTLAAAMTRKSVPAHMETF